MLFGPSIRMTRYQFLPIVCHEYFMSYDPHRNQWAIVKPMGTRRDGVSVSVLSGCLYAIGGWWESSVESYDPHRNQWAIVKPMGTRRDGVSVSVLSGCLYAIGGWWESSVERFDPRVGKWEQIRPMAARRGCLGSAVSEGYLYAAGGHDGTTCLSAVEKYDPRTNQWTAVADMNEKRLGVALATFNGRLCAVGGQNDTTDLNAVEVFDPEANQWVIYSPMNGRCQNKQAKIKPETIDIAEKWCITLNNLELEHLISLDAKDMKTWAKEVLKEEVELKDVEASALDALVNFCYSGKIRINSTNVPSEEQVFEAVVKWVSFDLPARRQLFPKLFEHVRLSLCDPKFLVNTVSNDTYVNANAVCRNLVDKAKLEDTVTTGASSPLWKVLLLEKLFGKTGEVGVAVIDNLLYAVGGSDGKTVLKSVERFDPATGAWSSDIAPMSHDRWGHAVAALDGSIYVVGGLYCEAVHAVERYDPCRNQWACVAPMGTKRIQCSVSVLNGCLYAIGGWNALSAERFDPRVGKWEQIRPMTTRRGSFGSAVLEGHLYAAGGFSVLEPLGSVENYDPRTNTWTAVADMNEKRFN
ncbi:kelch repeat protein, partial [Teladorsagia circumcincta]